MNEKQKRDLIDRFIDAYNRFDVELLMTFVHPHIEFLNVENGEVSASARGTEEFRALAEQSVKLFSSREQSITRFRVRDEGASVEIDYTAVLAEDLPNGIKSGETLRLTGRSDFTFMDGKISKLVDYS
jgi:ketosteroid isomerase-like protein